MKLDIGCGLNSKGDVNCDLYINDINGHRGIQPHQKIPLKPKQISNFVLCHAQYLPFKNDAFTEVISDQVIEHVPDPYKSFKEWLRVTSNKLTIGCPHRLGERILDQFSRKGKQWNKIHHINKFNFRWFKQAAQKQKAYVSQTLIKTYIYFPHNYMPILRFPGAIEVEIIKNKT